MAARKKPAAKSKPKAVPAVDTAFVYSANTGQSDRRYGIFVRLSHDPETKKRADDTLELFFAFKTDGGAVHEMYSTESLSDLKQEYRKGEAEQAEFNEWMRIHYNK